MDFELLSERVLNIFSERNLSQIGEQLSKEKIGFLTRIFESADLIATFQVPSINIYTNTERSILITVDIDQNIISIYNWTISNKEKHLIRNLAHPDQSLISKHIDLISEIKDIADSYAIILELRRNKAFEQRSSVGEDIEVFFNPYTEDLILNQERVLTFFVLTHKHYIR